MAFEIFICYKRFSADDLAERLKNALSDFDISAFLDIADIPKEFESTEKWWDYRNQAIRDCKTFLMIVTKGFERSPEIAEELKLAKDHKKNFMCFRWKNLDPEIIISLGTESLNLQNLQQIPFETQGELVRRFFDSYPKLSEKPAGRPVLQTLPSHDIPQALSTYPQVHFEITQAVQNTPITRSLPDVGFNIRNWNDRPILARVQARVFLGGRDLGLVRGYAREGKYIGYYDGKTHWNLNPYTIVFGHFGLPAECVKSNETLMIQVKLTLEELNGQVYEFLPVGWTYMRDTNDWFFEPSGNH